LEVRPPEGLDARRAAKLGEEFIGDFRETGSDVGRQRVGIALGERMQRGVHDLTAQRLIRLKAERPVRFEPQNLPREDLIRVRDPALYTADAKLRRPAFNRRTGRRRLDRLEPRDIVACTRPLRPRLGGFEPLFQLRGTDESEQPLQPA
jgi:hypothetical protein